ncbi:MAG TPA: rhodanese-like domain-containing protein [Syntrophomonadaceae bacterium]|nr:rhodanese-like domain-containing protein [Syntrophomonadaceae bacterium]HQE23683.1 rhodanese-like domain-containing protein [Syntrophomonadaceae bacterium]
MKKVFLILFMALFLVSGCGNNDIENNLIFNATVESVQDNSILVTTTEDVGFDIASVGFDENLEIPFDLAEGQVIEIEALPEIRESHPVQITAVKISLLEEPKKNNYIKITPQEAQEMMTRDAIILDVRTQTEFDEGHIPNAVLLPDTEIKQRAEEVLPDKEQTILVYCRSGRRSALAAQELADMGYTNVYDFGGILDWTGDVVK